MELLCSKKVVEPGEGKYLSLHDYFAWATTTTMSRYHRSPDDVPNGLSIPHWSCL